MSHAFIICNHFNLLFPLQGGFAITCFPLCHPDRREGSPSSLIAKTVGMLRYTQHDKESLVLRGV